MLVDEPLFIILCVLSFVSTEACPFNKPRSSSLDPFIESSFSIEPNISSPSKSYINRNKEYYANYQSEDNVVHKSEIDSTGTEKNCLVSTAKSQMRSDKPETSTNSTTFTVAPSISSSSSSAPSSTAPLSPISMDCDLKSPTSLHDSTISRLIDAVSLGNEQDTCGSISALIGQFESTVDQNDLTVLSHDQTPFCHSNVRPTAPKVLQDLRSPLKTSNSSTNNRPTTPKVLQDSKSPLKANTASNLNKYLISPQKVSQKTNHTKQNAPVPAVLSSPETAELEEVYTILDEEVLSPVSVYNLKQTVHVRAENIPSNSLGSSPAKVGQGFRKGHNVSWDDMHRKKVGTEEIEEAEESVYEEVYDPPAPVPEIERDTAKRYMGSSVNNDCFQFFHESAGNAFAEVEINVDEDPLERMLTSPRHSSQLEELISPTKRHAIYQNHQSTPNYSQQKQPSSYCNHQQQYPLHASHRPFSQASSPMNQPSYQLPNHHRHQNNSQQSPFHRTANSRPSNHSPLRQNIYPVPKNNSEAFNNSRDFSSSYTQQGSYIGSQNLNRSHQDRQANKPIDREQARCFPNGFSSSESLPCQYPMSSNICRDRGLYSPSSDCDAVYSRLDNDCITPPPDSSATQTPQPHCQSPKQSYTSKQSWNQKVSLSNTRHQSKPESTVSLHSNVGPLSTKPKPGTTDSLAPNPCKSKSLGDLTSEDISCNFQSKYHIISRSFITPHMRKQKRMGAMGQVTFQSQSCDPLTEQLRKLVSLEADDSDRDRPQPPQLCQEPKSQSQLQATSIAPAVPRDVDDSPPLLTRRLSSRSQSRVRHINNRARERQQEALKPRAGVVINSTASIGGVVLRNKPASQNPPANRHSTGSYIAGYLGQLEDRGLPEGACTSLHYGNGDHFGDRYYTDDSLPPADCNHSASEPEVYFLLRL